MYICIQKGKQLTKDNKMLYYADDSKATKIEKINKCISYVQSILQNEMESWQREEYEWVLESYKNELALVSSN